jgi:hypothetical protein
VVLVEHNAVFADSLRDKLAKRQPITITVEYSCLDKQGQQEDMSMLKRWHDEGVVQLQGTEAMIAEFEKANPGVKEKLEGQYSCLAKLTPSFGTDLGHWRLGRGRLGVATTLRNGRDFFAYCREFEQLMFPNGCGKPQDVHDVEHISIHYLFARDMFITRNTHHFRAEELVRGFADLTVLTPGQCVDTLHKAHG